MEHNALRLWAEDNNVTLSKQKERRLLLYAQMIYAAGRKFNITGLKTQQDIISKLIIGSLDPIISMNVPRGTLFADIGTGAGIPGVPIAIVFEDCHGVLMDSNHKKISFINAVIDELNLKNLNTRCGRIEELARGKYRNSFYCAFSRAMASMFVLVELAAPILMMDGFLYVYSTKNQKDMDDLSLDHCNKVGMNLLLVEDHVRFGIKKNGLLVQKKFQTDTIFPRKMAVINRDLKKVRAT